MGKSKGQTGEDKTSGKDGKKAGGLLREGIAYIIVGVITTAIDYIVSNALFYIGKMGSVPSQAISFVAAVLFAFVANKWWVFQSRTLAPRELWREFYSFVLCRVATFIFSLAAGFLLVDVMGQEFFFCKILISVVVMVLNYIFSKVLIFARKK